jgi:predicted acylesterase/phospholipase RssA
LLELTNLLVDRVANPIVAKARVATVAMVPAGDTDPRLVARFARALATSLRRHVSVAVASAPDVVGSEPGAVTEQLDRLEGEAEVVLLCTGSELDAWTAACVRHADRVLLVADVASSEGLAAAERAEGLARRELVLLHPAGRVELTGTQRWLDRPVAGRHQVRVGSRADCDRVARALLGRSVGLVLGGGGPRGFAHLGAIRALQEAGMPIDAVAGTSIGALMGAGVAYGWDAAETIDRATAALAIGGRLLRPTLPLVSLTSSRRVERLLRSPEFLGERRLEDALVPWFCVSTSLRDARVVVHDRGPAWRGVRSSFALPGILPPVFDDGDLLVDGGVLDNLPVDVMRARLTGTVLAVDLEPEDERHDHSPFESSVTGWQALRHRLDPRSSAPRTPTALGVLLRAKQVGVRHLQHRVLADHPVELHLRPPMTDLGALDFKGGADLVELAYRHTADVLARHDLAALLA